MSYYRQLKDKITNNTKHTVLDVRFNQAMLAAKKNAGYREEEILNDIQSVEINGHIYPGDRYLTATVFNKENSFDFIIEHETDRKNGYKPGDIVG